MTPALPVLLDMVKGPERLPADEDLQEMLRGKLRILQADSSEVTAVFAVHTTHTGSSGEVQASATLTLPSVLSVSVYRSCRLICSPSTPKTRLFQ